MPLLWETIGIIELQCGLYVISTTSDGAPPKRRTYRLHKLQDEKPNSDICYRSVNIFALYRYIYFFSDALHLIKTTRNCLYHSSYAGTRYMWNKRKYLLRGHIVKMRNQDLDNQLRPQGIFSL